MTFPASPASSVPSVHPQPHPRPLTLTIAGPNTENIQARIYPSCSMGNRPVPDLVDACLRYYQRRGYSDSEIALEAFRLLRDRRGCQFDQIGGSRTIALIKMRLRRNGLGNFSVGGFATITSRRPFSQCLGPACVQAVQRARGWMPSPSTLMSKMQGQMSRGSRGVLAVSELLASGGNTPEQLQKAEADRLHARKKLMHSKEQIR